MASPYTDKRLLEILRDLAAELGQSPTAQKMQDRRDLPSAITYVNHFGSWNGALEAAGLKVRPRRTPVHYTDEQLLKALRNLVDELDKTPTIQELAARRDLPSPGVYVRRFGSWRNALARLGMKSRTRSPRYTAPELLDALRDLADDLDKTPTFQQMQDRRDLPNANAYVYCFGGWNAALEAAGLEPRCRLTYPDEQLLQALRDLADELGKTPTIRELLARRDLPSPGAYHKRFGSWNAALETAGLEPRCRLTYPDEQLLQALRDLADDLGKTPTIQKLLAQRDLPSPGAYQKRFGSWNAALETAGLEPNRRRRRSPDQAREGAR